MKDTFSTYHPVLNMFYFVGTIGITVFERSKAYPEI